jgi:transcriptional regulator with XRE-family HTH domain
MQSQVAIFIADHLRARQMSVPDVERKIGMSRAFIGKLLNKPRGRGHPMLPETLDRLADAVGADVRELTYAEMISCGYKLPERTGLGPRWAGSKSWNEVGRKMSPAQRDAILAMMDDLLPGE